MPRHTPISPADIDWLRANHRTLTQREMAERIGCCVDTLKRALMREGLREFDGAKYVAAVPRYTDMWTRPCLDCGSKEQRPKGWYFCRPCRTKRGYHNDED